MEKKNKVKQAGKGKSKKKVVKTVLLHYNLHRNHLTGMAEPRIRNNDKASTESC
jgi:hypothetical protein